MPTDRFAGFVFCALVVAWPARTHAQPETLDTAKIDSHVEAVMASARIPGVAVGIVHEDRVVYLKGYGDAGNGGPVTPQTQFSLASVSKPFTALAVMQLVEAGKVDLDQPVQKYLPEFQLADADAASRITVRHLLTHASGLHTVSGLQHFLSRENSPDALAGYVREFAAVRPTAPAGAKYQYSNANYTLLASLVEIVSGEPFEQYMRDHVLTPLGMPRTCFSSVEAKDRVIGHRYWFGWPVAFSGLPSSRHHLGACGIHSSAEELSQFLIAHLNGGRIEGRSVLSAEGIAALQKPAVEIRPKRHYALGWFHHDDPNGQSLSHEGDWPDCNAELVMNPDDRWGVVVLMNANGPAGLHLQGGHLAKDVFDLARGQPAVPPKEATFLVRHFPRLLIGLPSVQLLLALLFYRRVRRWWQAPQKRPQRWWRVWAWHGAVVLINLALAFAGLIAPRAVFGITLGLGFLYTPDLALLAVIISGFALLWCVIRTVLVVRSYRAFGPPTGLAGRARPSLAIPPSNL